MQRRQWIVLQVPLCPRLTPPLPAPFLISTSLLYSISFCAAESLRKKENITEKEKLLRGSKVSVCQKSAPFVIFRHKKTGIGVQ